MSLLQHKPYLPDCPLLLLSCIICFHCSPVSLAVKTTPHIHAFLQQWVNCSWSAFPERPTPAQILIYRFTLSKTTHELLFIDAGPNTVVGLSKQAEGVSLDASKAVAALLPAYTQLLETLKGLGVPEVQFHEPILTTHRADALKGNFQSTYEQLSKAGLPIDLVTYYDDVGAAYPWVVQLPVQVLFLPLVNITRAEIHGFHFGMVLPHPSAFCSTD